MPEGECASFRVERVEAKAGGDGDRQHVQVASSDAGEEVDPEGSVPVIRTAGRLRDPGVVSPGDDLEQNLASSVGGVYRGVGIACG